MKNGRKKGRKLEKAVIVAAVAVLSLAAAIGVFQFASPLKGMFTPKKVDGLTADVCYNEITLKWKSDKRASKYTVQEMTEDGWIETIGTAKGNSYVVKDYDREKEHEYTVTACGEDPFNKNEYMGESSDPVKAYYDSSKYAQKIPVLSYHQVQPKGTEVTNSNCIAEDMFEEQMKYLHENGFATLTMDEFRQWHAGKKEFPVKSCVVTFDDGFYGTYYLAYPIIKKFDQAATVFCIGHHIGETTDEYDPEDEKSHYVGMDVIGKTREEYPRFEFQSHTYNMHKRIGGKKPVKVLSYDDMVKDCEKNREFGFDYMAYPWGTYTEEMQKALAETGYKMAFAYRPFYYATRDNDTYAIDRVKVNGTKDFDNFKKIVDGKVEKYDRP